MMRDTTAAAISTSRMVSLNDSANKMQNPFMGISGNELGPYASRRSSTFRQTQSIQTQTRTRHVKHEAGSQPTDSSEKRAVSGSLWPASTCEENYALKLEINTTNDLYGSRICACRVRRRGKDYLVRYIKSTSNRLIRASRWDVCNPRLL